MVEPEVRFKIMDVIYRGKPARSIVDPLVFGSMMEDNSCIFCLKPSNVLLDLPATKEKVLCCEHCTTYIDVVKSALRDDSVIQVPYENFSLFVKIISDRDEDEGLFYYVIKENDTVIYSSRSHGAVYTTPMQAFLDGVENLTTDGST